MHSGRLSRSWGPVQRWRLICVRLLVDVNPVACTRHAKPATVQGHSHALVNYGLHLRNGYGVGVNPTESARYMKLAADQGDSEAQAAYGRYLRQGYGVGVNPTESARYMKLAADQGLAQT